MQISYMQLTSITGEYGKASLVSQCPNSMNLGKKVDRKKNVN